MKISSSSGAVRFTFVLAAFLVSASGAFAQHVAGFVIAKGQNFQQTSAAAPVANPTQPFQFGSLVQKGTATINSATLTFSGSASPRTFTPETSGDFSILDTFTTQAQLDAAYGSGNYSLNVATDAGNFSRTIFLLPFSYPTTPRLTVPATDWQNGVLVIDPSADYTFMWSAFSNAQAADLIQLVIRGSGVNLAPFPATQTSYTLPAGSLQPGTTYACDLVFARVAGAAAGDANIGPGYATLVKDAAFTIRTLAPALALQEGVSRKTHGAAGTFDVPLPGVESRAGGASGDHTLVFTFTNNVVSGSATISNGVATLSGAPVFSGNTMTVNLTGVTNAQTITVTITNVTDAFAQTLPDTAVAASFLVGDTTGNGAVTASDVGQTRSVSGQPTDATNFRADLNVSGSITASDVGFVKSQTGAQLPP